MREEFGPLQHAHRPLPCRPAQGFCQCLDPPDGALGHIAFLGRQAERRVRLDPAGKLIDQRRNVRRPVAGTKAGVQCLRCERLHPRRDQAHRFYAKPRIDPLDPHVEHAFHMGGISRGARRADRDRLLAPIDDAAGEKGGAQA